ncbi:MAG: 3-hydroxyacyl-CoA dehydrogenase family protein [Solirubrobacterales bacterium]|nr:3-hydroxyacyl-CoA dehydrogenase family protein [Solirubrobacterales bacterium]
MDERVAVVGSGAIACGLAATASANGQVVLWARSDSSAERARKTVEKVCSKMEADVDAGRVTVATDLDALADATIVVEAVVEDLATKSSLLQDVAARVGDSALLATTTSSLSVAELAQASGRPDRFVGLHVFNPVAKMKLVELAFPDAATEETRERARALCLALGKEAVEVPDIAGFVVNRLLFPYLFSAVTLMEETGLEPKAIDTCMALGAGHPMGPLALIDYVGLDVSKAIAQSTGTPIPATIDQLISEGALGKKSGRGLYDYSD